MKHFLNSVFLFGFFPLVVSAQQQVTIISRCGGTQTVEIPTITDNDQDGMDDALEQRLLEHFMPVIIQFDGDNCPGPALNGTGDSNLVVCRIFPIPAQYTPGGSPDSVKTHPVGITGDTALEVGMAWYQSMVMVRCALLYGKDCGLLGHTADVEGFSFSLKYIGADSLAGWMYDTVMQHWIGVDIQTVSHADTPCEHIETGSYRSAVAPNGFDTIFASPDKHGNYLTVAECGSSVICNPACNGVASEKTIKAVNIGEPNASLVNDLGDYYAAYAGNDPWSTSNFLAQQNGSAGTIGEKMAESISVVCLHGQTLNSATEICDLYRNCFACGDSVYDACVASGGPVPVYHCSPATHIADRYTNPSIIIFPISAGQLLRVIYPDGREKLVITLYDTWGRGLRNIESNTTSASIDISGLTSGLYILRIAAGSKVAFRKVVIE